jgi:hypothetical protein
MNADLIPVAISAVLCLWWAFAAVALLLSALPGTRRNRLLDRWDAASRTASLGFLAPLCLVVVTWTVVPVAVWYLLTALSAAAVAFVVLRLPGLPPSGDDRAVSTRRASAIGNTALAVAAIAALVLFLP